MGICASGLWEVCMPVSMGVWGLCVCVYECICIWAYVGVYVCMQVCVWVYGCVSICVYMGGDVSVCMCTICMYKGIHVGVGVMYVSVCVCVWVYVSVCVCI